MKSLMINHLKLSDSVLIARVPLLDGFGNSRPFLDAGLFFSRVAFAFHAWGTFRFSGLKRAPAPFRAVTSPAIAG